MEKEKSRVCHRNKIEECYEIRDPRVRRHTFFSSGHETTYRWSRDARISDAISQINRKLRLAPSFDAARRIFPGFHLSFPLNLQKGTCYTRSPAPAITLAVSIVSLLLSTVEISLFILFFAFPHSYRRLVLYAHHTDQYDKGCLR